MLAAMKRKCPELLSGENDEMSRKARAFSVHNLLNIDISPGKIERGFRANQNAWMTETIPNEQGHPSKYSSFL